MNLDFYEIISVGICLLYTLLIPIVILGILSGRVGIWEGLGVILGMGVLITLIIDPEQLSKKMEKGDK